MTSAALRYASALARGYADPAKINATYTIPRPDPKVTDGLASALQNGDLEQWFASLPPQTDEYRALSQAHLRFLRLAGEANSSPIPDGKAIKPGRRDPRNAAVAAALRASGYLAPPASNASGPTRYTGSMITAVRREVNAMWLPFGENAGSKSSLGWSVSRSGGAVMSEAT